MIVEKKNEGYKDKGKERERLSFGFNNKPKNKPKFDDNFNIKNSAEKATSLQGGYEKHKDIIHQDDDDVDTMPSHKKHKTENDDKDSQHKKKLLVFTETQEFVQAHYYNKPSPSSSSYAAVDNNEPKASAAIDDDAYTDQKNNAIDGTLREVPIGKGLSQVLHLLKDRGTLGQQTDEWSGRNVDKKKSKIVGLDESEMDEYGRALTPKEKFRLLSHRFHGKGPGKKKQEKRMREVQKELNMKNVDTALSSAERMRQVQAHLKTPYLVLTGNALKPCR